MFELHTPTPEEQKALDKAKIALMNRPKATFYCEIGFSLKYRWTCSIPTAATDGIHMFLNPKWFLELAAEERLGLVIHEILHVAYMHPLRKGSKNHKIWNIACDHVINLIILQSGFQLPPDGYHDPKYTGMSAEQVYDDLIKNAKTQPPDKTKGIGDDLIDPPPGMTADEVTAKIEQTLIRASIRCAQEKAFGSIPGDIQLLIDKLLKPKLPWNRILQKYINQFAKSDYSFRKLNRRYLPGLCLPSLHSETLMDMAIAVDISGSVSDHEFKRFVSEIALIFRMLKPKKITLIQFDTAIRNVNEIHNLVELVRVNFKGRGGTDIGQLIDWTNKHKPQLLMVFTDGEFSFKHYNTQREVLWLIHNNPGFKPKFGKAIHYGIND